MVISLNISSSIFEMLTHPQPAIVACTCVCVSVCVCVCVHVCVLVGVALQYGKVQMVKHIIVST